MKMNIKNLQINTALLKTRDTPLFTGGSRILVRGVGNHGVTALKALPQGVVGGLQSSRRGPGTEPLCGLGEAPENF